MPRSAETLPNVFFSNEQSENGPNQAEARLTHNCGIVGFYYFNHETAGNIAGTLDPMKRVNHRGQEGLGTAAIGFDGKVQYFKTKGLVRHNEKLFDEHRMKAQVILGHCRYSTSGESDTWQPFIDEDAEKLFHIPKEKTHKVFLIHNGNLTNPLDLKKFIPPEFHDCLRSDSHALFLALKYASGDTFEDRLNQVLPETEGAFSLILTNPETNDLYLVRDASGFRPLHYGPLKDGSGFIAASETYALSELVEYDQIQEVQYGQCLKINKNGVQEIKIDFKPVQTSFCTFEKVYLGFPSSVIFGVPVAAFRNLCGQVLAERDIEEGFIPDIVVGIKESGSIASDGYQYVMEKYLNKLAYKDDPDNQAEYFRRIDVMRNNHALYRIQNERTFIKPLGRRQAINEKFAFDPKYIKDFVAAVPDDSIVFGNTMIAIIANLRSAQIREVHVRSASPAIISRCKYGVNQEGPLIAEGRDNEQIAQILNADSVRYTTTKDMMWITQKLGAVPEQFCHACFTGKHPIQYDERKMIHTTSVLS